MAAHLWGGAGRWPGRRDALRNPALVVVTGSEIAAVGESGSGSPYAGRSEAASAASPSGIAGFFAAGALASCVAGRPWSERVDAVLAEIDAQALSKVARLSRRLCRRTARVAGARSGHFPRLR